MTYKTEFPNFDPATLPAIPSDWLDTSWHNDTCPCWQLPSGHYLYIDYADTSLREFPETTRYTLHDDPETRPNGVYRNTDSFDAILLAIEFSALIRRDLTPEQLAKAVERNRGYGPGVCATHDFMDANVTMHEAFERTLARDPLATPFEGEEGAGMNQADIDLWCEAWDIAKMLEFRLGLLPTYDIEVTRDREGNEMYSLAILQGGAIVHEQSFYDLGEANAWVEANYPSAERA